MLPGVGEYEPREVRGPLLLRGAANCAETRASRLPRRRRRRSASTARSQVLLLLLRLTFFVRSPLTRWWTEQSWR